jgi:cytochrome c peroxidase
MKRNQTLLFLLLCVAGGAAWTSGTLKPHPLKFEVPAGWPQPMYDFRSNPLTQEGFELGRKLFYDPRLSKDSNFSCAGCHQQFGAFATSRNAPSLSNLAWQKNFMWDGGVTHLDLQPLVPMTAPNEMAETIENVISKLKGDAEYPKLFRAAFGDDVINTQRMNRALSQFMLMLVSNNSKYDRVKRGEASFILPEQLGYDMFKQKCASCHAEPFFTDFSYRNTGLPVDPYLKDYGRMRVTGDRADSLKFRVPSLRNVALTFPYGHDGRFMSLMSIFEHYRKNMVVAPGTDSLLRHRMPLSNFEIGQLTAFLYTLTDTVFLKDKRFSPPGTEIIPSFIHLH